MNSSDLKDNLNKLLNHLDSINDTLPLVLLLLEPFEKKASSKFLNFIEDKAEKIENEEDEKIEGYTRKISVKYEDSKVFEQLSKNSETSKIAMKIIPESLFVSLISQYDAFLNRLLKILFCIRPEYINSSERELTYSQLIDFSSIEDARDYIMEKEVETVLRKSHSDHFIYLEKKLGIPLRKNLEIWSTFIEITERRNLFVHCDGIVSNQYIKVCRENKCNIDNIELNTRLEVDIKYIIKTYECLYELSTKLTQTIWRKLFKEELEEADSALNEICYNLLTLKRFELADILLDFACNQPNHFNESSKNIFFVNKSISLYLNKQEEKAREILSNKDWSASSNDFKLVNFIINEENERVYDLMKKIGNNGEIHKESYRMWPLFYKLREEQEFEKTFKEIFNEDFTILEIPKKPIQEFLEEIFKHRVKKKITKNKE